MALFLPRRWRSQPQYPVGVNAKVSSQIVSAVNLLSRSPWDVVHGTILTPSSGVITAVGRQGIGVSVVGAADNIAFPADARYSCGTGSFSVLLVFRSASSSVTIPWSIGYGAAWDASPYYGPWDLTARGVDSIRSGITAELNTDYVILWAYNPNVGPTFTINNLTTGNLTQQTVASTLTPSAVTSTSYIGNYSGLNTGNNDLISLDVRWNRAIIGSEAIELVREPWANVFAPLHARRFFVGGGGPVIVTGSATARGGGAARAFGGAVRGGTARVGGGGLAKATGNTIGNGSATARGGGAAKAVGTSSIVTVGSAKAAGGGAAKATGSTIGNGSATARGGGAVKAVGNSSTVIIGSAKAVGGGYARVSGSGVVVGSARADGGGAARSSGAAVRVGVARCGGGGAATAASAPISRTGSAAAAGGGRARAQGSKPAPPGIVASYVHGWPVNGAGSVIVRVMP